MRSLTTLLLSLLTISTNGFELNLPFLSSPFQPKPSKTKTSDIPVVICPGFGNDEIDYLTPLNQPRETSLIAALERRGFENIYTIPLKRYEWIRVAGGLFDIPNFYTGNCLPTGLGYGWYVKRLKETVNQAYEETGQKVLLVGHSAGGWLARAAMGDGEWSEEISTKDRIRCLVTLGAIHKVPQDSNTCVTKGALLNTDAMYPGAFLKDDGIGYVSVGGCAVRGNNEIEEKEELSNASLEKADEMYSIRGEGSAARVAFNSYTAVAGEGNLVGDGVVPFEWTQLEGARQISLEGVVHSINEAGTTIPSDRWYGSENVMDRWLSAVMEEADLER